MTATSPNQGSDRGADSNPSSSPVTLTEAAQSDMTVDFGFYTNAPVDNCTGTFGNFVWYDANGNGVQDSGEFGLPGVTVTLTYGDQTRTSTTGSGGAYQFAGLCGGNYTVRTTSPSTARSGRPGLQVSPVNGAYGDTAKDSNANPFTATLSVNASDQTIDFGFKGVGGCTLTQGYWKTHSTVWPVSSLYLGGKLYTQTELLNILNSPVKGDASIALAYQLIAAKLNLYGGSNVPPAVATWIAQADAYLANFAAKIPLKSGGNATMTTLGASLDTYNNGQVAGTSHCN
jgi:hypothetical protein